MKRILTAILAFSLIIKANTGLSFADNESTPVNVADSVEELTREAGAADTASVFSFDVTQENDPLATEELNAEVEDIASGSGSTSEKRDAVARAMEDSGYYATEKEGKGKLRVLSLYSNQRILLKAPYTQELESYGADTVVFYEDHYLLTYKSEEDTKTAFEALVDEYGKDSVVLDVPISLSSVNWGTEHMGMDQEKVSAEEGADVTVAVIDSGINRDHEVFAGRDVKQGYNIANGNTDTSDDVSHGTAVAGIIAESTGSNISILPVKIVGDDSSLSSLNVIYGAKYAVEQGADILNFSLGGYLTEQEYDNLSTLLSEAVTDDTILVCASGNETVDMDESNTYVFPSEYPDAFCVGAFGKQGNISSFSNYGSAVDFAAPGERISAADNSSNDEYTSVKGTSFSAPFISAAAALIKARDTDAGREDVRRSLEEISVDMGETGKDPYFGSGCPVFIHEDPVDPDPTDPTQPDDPTDPDDPTIPDTPDTPDTPDDPDTPVTPEPSDPDPAEPVDPDPAEPSEPEVTEPLSVTLSDTEYTYDGTVKHPAVTARRGDSVLQKDEYEVDYTGNCTDAGEYTVTVSTEGEDAETVEETFVIKARHIEPQVTLSRPEYRYDGKEKTPSVTVKYGSKTIKDFDVTYPPGRINAGTYTVSVDLKGNYEGSGRASFIVRKTDSKIYLSPKKTVKIKRSKLKKKAQKIKLSKLMTVRGRTGDVSYYYAGVNKSKYKRYFSVNRKTGTLTVKKNLKKGTYKVTLKVTDKGNGNYSMTTKSVTVKIKVK